METSLLTAANFDAPRILLAGTVDYEMYACFREQFDQAPETGLVVIELSTLGGDPEVARMMGEDVRFHSELEPQRRFVFLGRPRYIPRGRPS
jgi:membrane-bound ClpP family serine protease